MYSLSRVSKIFTLSIFIFFSSGKEFITVHFSKNVSFFLLYIRFKLSVYIIINFPSIVIIKFSFIITLLITKRFSDCS